MTAMAHHRLFIPYFADKASAKSDALPKRPGLLRRLFDSILESRQKAADRDIARLLARSGGRLTDEIERQMTQSFFQNGWNVRP